jgi:ADP-heptose:LPS heptosyltransferase
LALLLKEAALLISNDSGPIHLAASQQVSILGLFGPTRPDLTGPIARGRSKILHKQVGCELPCYFRECDYRVCLDWLTPEEVFKEAGILLSE